MKKSYAWLVTDNMVAKKQKGGVPLPPKPKVYKEKKKKKDDLEIKDPTKVITFGAVSKKDLLYFTRNLAILLKTGSTLSESIAVLRDQQKKKTWKKILHDIYMQIEMGLPFAMALGRWPKLFPQIFRSVVAVGEQSGTLEENLGYIRTQMEKNYELKRAVLSSMMYPLIILIGTMFVGSGVALFVLPKLAELFESFQVDLPLTTRIMLWIAEFFTNNGLWAVPLTITLVIALVVVARMDFSRPLTHFLILKIPIMKSISTHLNLSYFCRTLSILLQAGITIDQALITCARTNSNYYYQKFIEQSQQQISGGRTLVDILKKKENLFPATDVQIIHVGEKSGTLSEALENCAEIHEKEVYTLTKNLATILEPIILLLLGGMVAVLALSVITPIYSITDQF